MTSNLATGPTVSHSTAAALFAELRGNLLAAEETITQIIHAKAWESLGYASLAEAWASEMKGVRLAGVVEAHLLYAMFEQGTSVNDAAQAVHGVGPTKANAYHHAWTRDLPPSQAERHAASMARNRKGGTYVGSHYRRKATKRNTITMEGFTDEEIETWKKAADARGVAFKDWARETFRIAMQQEVDNANA